MKKLYKSLFAGIALLGLSSAVDAQCTYTIQAQDSFGDGWNGGNLAIDVNGTVTNYTLPSGTAGSTTFSVVTGDPITLTWTPGGFNTEVSFQLLDDVGAIIGSYGPGPATGVNYSGVGLCTTCGLPSNILVSTVDNDSLFVAWDPASVGAMSYEMEWGPVGFTPGMGTTVTGITGTNDTISGLTQLTDYDVYIFTDCGVDSSAVVGPVTLSTGPNCPDVSGLTISSSTSDSIIVSWVSNGSETMWDVEYGPTGFVQGTGTIDPVTATTDSIGGLMQDTEYDIYVRSDCGGVDQGVWLGPITVFTSCAPVTVFPYLEDFEGAAPAWRAVGTNTTWDIGVPAGNTITSAASGNNAAVTNLTGNYNNSENGSLYTACFDFSALTNPVLTFNIFYDTENGFDESWVDVTTNDGATWTKLGNSTTGYSNWYNDPGNNWWEANSGGWVSASHPLSAFAGMSNVRFRIVFASDGSVNTFDGIGIDDFMIVDEPCARPTDFAAVSTVSDTLVLGWTAGGTETSWNIEYGPIGFTPGTGTSYTTTSNPDTLTGLADGSVFDFYITADCGSGLESNLLSPVLISTPILNDFACGAILINVDSTINTFANFGATSELGEDVEGTGNTIWFKAVVPASGHFAISTCNSPIRTEIVIYDSVPDCLDLNSTISSAQSTGANPFGCAFGFAGLENCGRVPGDTIYFTLDSYSFGDGVGIIEFVLFDLQYNAGTGGAVSACTGDTVNLDVVNSGTVSLNPGFWDYPANPIAILDDSLANTSNFTIGATDVFYIVSNSCTADTAVVTFDIASVANSGVALDPFNACNTGDVFLLDGLTGTIDAGGTWSDDLNTGLLVGGVFVANNLPVGQYQFTYTADNGACPAVSTQVTVDLNNCVGVEENEAEFNLFPNPNNGTFFITSSSSEFANVSIMDAQGRLVYSNATNLVAGQQLEMNMPSVESGLYLMTLELNGQSSTQTFIIK